MLDHGLNDDQIDQLFAELFQKDVLILDYSFRTREINDELYNITKSLRILDHHKTAQAVLEGAPYATFDMNRSGAGLAWDYLFGENSVQENWRDRYPWVTRPWWVNYVEDQDLWKWQLPHSQEINAFLMVQPKTTETWDKIAKMSPAQAREKGEGVRQYIEYYTRNVTERPSEGVIVWNGANLKTAIINIPYSGVSEAGNALVKQGYDVAFAWFERGDDLIQVSLRSDRDGANIDVSEIAKFYGGGGHRNAAGFQLSIEAGRRLVDKILGRSSDGAAYSD
jgi:oligoribonuclease NrnB/cAMP/cGMP phosphodiesterase (DHH superfamily)